MIGISQQELTHDKVTRDEVVPWRHKSRAACLSLVKHGINLSGVGENTFFQFYI